MNNNRGNNRRRGRGNNRQQGGQQVNRIDSRARGNAPQLLEKYRKLAHDAHLNGDRVTEEYYLQFADHYFRVIADQRQRQEESRQPRREDRPHDYRDYYDGDDDGFEPATHQDRAPRPEPAEAPPPPVAESPAPAPAPAAESEPADEDRSVYEPAENPFVRDNRATRGLKQRKPRGRPEREEPKQEELEITVAAQPAPAAFDPESLPPSIATGKPAKPARRPRKTAAEAAAPVEAEPADAPVAEDKPRRRRTRKADDAGATSEAVNG